MFCFLFFAECIVTVLGGERSGGWWRSAPGPARPRRQQIFAKTRKGPRVGFSGETNDLQTRCEQTARGQTNEIEMRGMEEWVKRDGRICRGGKRDALSVIRCSRSEMGVEQGRRVKYARLGKVFSGIFRWHPRKSIPVPGWILHWGLMDSAKNRTVDECGKIRQSFNLFARSDLPPPRRPATPRSHALKSQLRLTFQFVTHNSLRQRRRVYTIQEYRV